jgi:hypothetical protein
VSLWLPQATDDRSIPIEVQIGGVVKFLEPRFSVISSRCALVFVQVVVDFAVSLRDIFDFAVVTFTVFVGCAVVH